MHINVKLKLALMSSYICGFHTWPKMVCLSLNHVNAIKDDITAKTVLI